MNFKATVGLCAHRDVKIRVWNTLWSLKKCPNPEINVKILDGDALISRSRSRLATYFLDKTDDDVLLFLDDDVVISSFDATKLIWACKNKYPIVGAAYATKSKDNPGLAVRPLQPGVMRFGKNGGFTPMRSVSTGCMAIRREVFKKMVDSEIIHNCIHGDIRYYSFFQHREGLVNGIWEDLSEDWFFCENALKLGIDVFCDTTIKLGHVGAYEYNWDDVLNAKNRKIYDDIDFNTTVRNDEATVGLKGEQNGR